MNDDFHFIMKSLKGPSKSAPCWQCWVGNMPIAIVGRVVTATWIGRQARHDSALGLQFHSWVG